MTTVAGAFYCLSYIYPVNSITIRRASASDAELIADLSRQSFYETFASLNTAEDMELFMSKQFSREILIKEVEEVDGIFLLAFNGEESVGYARLREGDQHPEFNSEPAIEIARLYATKGSIGKGVGKELMQEGIRIARDMNRTIIWLGVWEKNDRAIAFYNKWGFEKFAEHDFVLGNDVQRDWLMYKKM